MASTAAAARHRSVVVKPPGGVDELCRRHLTNASSANPATSSSRGRGRGADRASAMAEVWRPKESPPDRRRRAIPACRVRQRTRSRSARRRDGRSGPSKRFVSRTKKVGATRLRRSLVLGQPTADLADALESPPLTDRHGLPSGELGGNARGAAAARRHSRHGSSSSPRGADRI